MENVKEEQPKLTAQFKEYIETRIKLARYQAIDKGSSLMAGIVVEIVSMICILIAFLFASITLALFLGHVFNSYWEGFGCVSVLYLVIVFVVSSIKNKVIEPLIINFLLKKVFKQKEK